MCGVRRTTAFFLSLVVLAGCKPSQPEPASKGSSPPRASVTLRVAVVDDEQLRRAIDRLRGEWQTLTDGQIETFAATLEEAADADLIVFPSRVIGSLSEAGTLRPVRESVLSSDALRFDDFLPLVRDHEVVYAQRVMALPIGCPSPLHLAPDSGANVLARHSDRDDVSLALAYLAWAAPHAVHRSRVATLFDADNFEPRLADPPFVRGLEDFVAQQIGGEGRIVWPSRQEQLTFRASPQVMPAAAENFNPMADQWEPMPAFPAGNRHATLLASSGRLIGVTTASRNAATAFRYAAWLVGPENARMLATASDNVSNCRGSLARAPDPWFKTEDREVGKAFAATSAEALRASRFLFAPRLPGAEEYLAVLGSRVRASLGGQPAAEALAEAAAEWAAISAREGGDAQREAYFRSINARPLPVTSE